MGSGSVVGVRITAVGAHELRFHALSFTGPSSISAESAPARRAAFSDRMTRSSQCSDADKAYTRQRRFRSGNSKLTDRHVVRSLASVH